MWCRIWFLGIFFGCTDIKEGIKDTGQDDKVLEAITEDSNENSNTIPIVESVFLEPTSAYTNDTITANVVISDTVIEQEVLVSYSWFVLSPNTDEAIEVQSGIENTVRGEIYFDRDDEVYVVVTQNTGLENEISITSSSVFVYNTPPSEPMVSVTPNPATNGLDDLICSVESTDIDEDELLYTYVWTDPNGIIQRTTSISEQIDVFPSSSLSGGTWTCSVTAFDGVSSSNTALMTTNVEELETCTSLEFDGIDDIILVSDHSAFSFLIADFTIESILYSYANCGDAYLNQCTYMSHSDGVGEVDKWSLTWSEQGYNEHYGHYAQIYSGQERWMMEYIQEDFEEKWVHVAYVRAGEHMYLYVDGEEVYSEDYDISMPNPSTDLLIGGAENNRWFSGKIHSIRISSVARYGSAFLPFQDFVSDADTIALWNFYDSVGSALYDSSGNGHHGTIDGGTWVVSCPEEDLDEDGTPSWQDCNDSDPNLQDQDFDEDGYSNCDGDCNLYDGNIHPYAGDVYGDGIDSDCDGSDVCAGGLFNGTYFTACYEPRTWQSALDVCQIRGHDGLATLLNDGENTFVHDLLPVHVADNSGLYWIGLTDSINEGSFVWSSGISSIYTNWNSLEPNDGSGIGEDCGKLYSNVFPQYLYWNDHPCSNNHSYVCEKR